MQGMTSMVPVCPYCGRVECICPAVGASPASAPAVSVTAYLPAAETPGAVRGGRAAAAPSS